jgi:hypothetical protein
MRKSVVVLTVLAIVSAMSVGCVPNAEGTIAFSPRVYPYVPTIGPGPSADKPGQGSMDR